MHGAGIIGEEEAAGGGEVDEFAERGLAGKIAGLDVKTAEGGGWDFIRVHFKIWPGQGNLIETTFRQQIVSAMKVLSPNYADWQVPVTYRAMTAAKNLKPRMESSSGEPPGT